MLYSRILNIIKVADVKLETASTYESWENCFAVKVVAEIVTYLRYFYLRIIKRHVFIRHYKTEQIKNNLYKHTQSIAK